MFSPFVADAVMRIEAGALNEDSVDALALGLGVTARHLRRTMQGEVGVSPIELAQASRLSLASRLIQETSLTLTEIAFAAGFRSLRRFNALFASARGESPGELRKRSEESASGEGIALRIEYRGALDWERMREAISARTVAGVERFDRFAYARTLRFGAKKGWIAVYPRIHQRALIAEISIALVPHVMPIVARLRALFDLDSGPAKRPRAFDGFETAAIAVCGADAIARLVPKICARYPRHYAQLTHLPFSAQAIITAKKPKELLPIAKAVRSGELSLAPTADPAALARALKNLGVEARAIEEIAERLTHHVTKRRLKWTRDFSASS